MSECDVITVKYLVRCSRTNIAFTTFSHHMNCIWISNQFNTRIWSPGTKRFLTKYFVIQSGKTFFSQAPYYLRIVLNHYLIRRQISCEIVSQSFREQRNFSRDILSAAPKLLRKIVPNYMSWKCFILRFLTVFCYIRAGTGDVGNHGVLDLGL